MEAVKKNENSRFLSILKRIWDGPNYEEMEDIANMQFDKSNVTNFKIEVKADEPEPPVVTVPKLAEPGRPDHQPLKPDFHTSKLSEMATNDFGSQKQTTVISKGTVFTGDFKSDGNLEMYGTVTGSINATGNIKICGKQIGDVQGANITLSSCTVRGNVSATEDMTIDSDSVVIGDIKTKNLMLNGKLQGNIHAKSSITCQSDAIVIGDLTAATVTVNNGSKLQGKVQIFNGQMGEIKIPDDDKNASVII